MATCTARHVCAVPPPVQLLPGCTTVEVRKAYRRLAASLHPDKCTEPGAQEAFIRVNDSYKALLRRGGAG